MAYQSNFPRSSARMWRDDQRSAGRWTVSLLLDGIQVGVAHYGTRRAASARARQWIGPRKGNRRHAQ